MVVLEVGAGKGFLAHHIKQQLKKQSDGTIEYVATDIWPLDSPFSSNVRSEDYQAALRDVKPHVVICSWMPMSSDWSRDFRNCVDTVQEYILIGEADNGACGHNWETWGNPFFHPCAGLPPLRDMDVLPNVEDLHVPVDLLETPPPYHLDGWRKNPLDHISHFQLQRFDAPAHFGNSQTVSFTKDASKNLQ
jgi:hypothetical protein